jgi:hypothetical protein
MSCKHRNSRDWYLDWNGGILQRNKTSRAAWQLEKFSDCYIRRQTFSRNFKRGIAVRT